MTREVLRLSEIRRPVTVEDGTRVGELRDLTVRLRGIEDGAQPVEHLVVRDRRTERLVRVADVLDWGPHGVEVGAADAGREVETDDELRLGRDVLDAQVFDTAGRRLMGGGRVR